MRNKASTLMVFLFIFGLSFSAKAQNDSEELEKLINQVYVNNFDVKVFEKQIKASEVEQKTAFQLSKTNLYYSYDQNNLTVDNIPLHVFGVSQDFKFPSFYIVQKQFIRDKTAVIESRLNLLKNQLAFNISLIYNDIVYLQHLETYYIKLDSVYGAFSMKSSRKHELGETNYLEKITAEAKYKQIQTQWKQIRDDKNAKYEQLKSIMHSDDSISISQNKLMPIFVESSQSEQLIKTYFECMESQLETETRLQRQEYLPDLMAEYFHGDNKGVSHSLYGVKFGISIPLFFSKNSKKVTMSKLNEQSWTNQKSAMEHQIFHFIKQKEQESSKYHQEIDYFLNTGKKLSQEIYRVALSSYKNGEIDYFQYILSLENSFQIELNYLNALVLFNKTSLEIQYLNLP